jgi:hypothetical protein
MSEKFESENYSFVDEERIGHGMEADVDLVKMKRGNREISLVRKRLVKDGIFAEGQGIEKFRKSVKVHQMLKKKKYPVPNVWRLDEKANELYVSDLSEEGKRIVIDGSRLSKISRGKETAPIKLNENIRQQLRHQLIDISAKADNDNFAVPSDVWFVVADKDGEKAEIVMGDITGISEMEQSEATKKAVEVLNKNSINSFAHALDALS